MAQPVREPIEHGIEDEGAGTVRDSARKPVRAVHGSSNALSNAQDAKTGPGVAQASKSYPASRAWPLGRGCGSSPRYVGSCRCQRPAGHRLVTPSWSPAARASPSETPGSCPWPATASGRPATTSSLIRSLETGRSNLGSSTSAKWRRVRLAEDPPSAKASRWPRSAIAHICRA
jgi:hypothetical protein